MLLRREEPATALARRYGVSENTPYKWREPFLEGGRAALAKRQRRPLHIPGIDEVSRKKGHKYLTVVYDLDRGQVAWIGKDRTQETVNP